MLDLSISSTVGTFPIIISMVGDQSFVLKALNNYIAKQLASLTIDCRDKSYTGRILYLENKPFEIVTVNGNLYYKVLCMYNVATYNSTLLQQLIRFEVALHIKFDDQIRQYKFYYGNV